MERLVQRPVNMAKRIRLLVACDGLEGHEGLPGAILGIARHLGAEVVLFHAVPKLLAAPWRSRQVPSEELQRLLVEERTRQLDQRAHALPGVATSISVAAGEPAAAIVAAAVEHQCDLVVLPERGSEQRDFGTTTIKVMRKSPISVWAVRTSGRDYPMRILAAVDVTSKHAENQLLNDYILEVALALARHPKACLWVHHSWDLWGEQLLTSVGRESQDELRLLATDEENTHRRELADVLQRHDTDGVNLQVELTRGDPPDSIAAAIEGLGIELLIVGTASRSGLPGLLIGNTVERVLNRVGCSVLAVKPHGSVLPLVAASEQAKEQLASSRR